MTTNFIFSKLLQFSLKVFLLIFFFLDLNCSTQNFNDIERIPNFILLDSNNENERLKSEHGLNKNTPIKVETYPLKDVNESLMELENAIESLINENKRLTMKPNDMTQQTPLKEKSTKRTSKEPSTADTSRKTRVKLNETLANQNLLSPINLFKDKEKNAKVINRQIEPNTIPNKEIKRECIQPLTYCLIFNTLIVTLYYCLLAKAIPTFKNNNKTSKQIIHEEKKTIINCASYSFFKKTSDTIKENPFTSITIGFTLGLTLGCGLMKSLFKK